ncbi:DUF3426 domain-containing protein [Microbulbifer bruguierae]|uniref:DUF3426 domain-containing protein n=1 Tax=Microbulbifer bruguierae TaxID=3029061 RepID=A0ABY8N8T0_9GAMM|nr:DUF3426 domain-containing protein [Microbulbifer bruguierae]WGL15012.1 DUF3426 domain-containing protein [Microbulbifer bruguierae]
MTQLVTRCPHCSTSFHVSEQQLRAARGAVRCGSCLQVFRADENIVFNEDDPQPASKKAIDELLEDDDFLIHDDIELDGDDLSDEADELPRARKEKAAEKPAETREPRQNPLIDDAFGEHQWQEIDSSSDEEPLNLKDDIEAASDSPWAEEIAREESSGIDRDRVRPRPEEDLFADDDLDDGLDAVLKQDEDLVEHDGPSFAADSGFENTRNYTPPDLADDHIDASQRDAAPLLPRDQLISAIGPAPLEVSWQPKTHNRISGWLWTLGVVVLMLGLAAQTAYFRFDSLSKRDPWRDIYARICPIAGCTLPAQVDIGAIYTSNLVVRSHPQTPGALAVEAILLNRAPFDQPFPALQLRFTDLKNAPVASRRFTPGDYLKGELAGRKLMPTGSPVHIALDIVDPGAEAVNYELRIAQQ